MLYVPVTEATESVSSVDPPPAEESLSEAADEGTIGETEGTTEESLSLSFAL